MYENPGLGKPAPAPELAGKMLAESRSLGPRETAKKVDESALNKKISSSISDVLGCPRKLVNG